MLAGEGVHVVEEVFVEMNWRVIIQGFGSRMCVVQTHGCEFWLVMIVVGWSRVGLLEHCVWVVVWTFVLWFLVP